MRLFLAILLWPPIRVDGTFPTNGVNKLGRGRKIRARIRAAEMAEGDMQVKIFIIVQLLAL